MTGQGRPFLDSTHVAGHRFPADGENKVWDRGAKVVIATGKRTGGDHPVVWDLFDGPPRSYDSERP